MNDIKELYVRSLIYDAVAQLLPTMGRDFNIKISFIDDNHMNIDVIAMTPIGEAIKSELLADLKPKIFELMADANKEPKDGNKRTDEADSRPDAGNQQRKTTGGATPSGNALQNSNDNDLI